MTRQIDKDLLDTSAYPEPTTKVELVQTHISFVFLTDNFVYKVKKPVNFGFVDFSTLEKRAQYCNNEVTLNRRLSPDTYLEVLPVTEEGGRLRIGGSGDLVDYCVKMKRLSMDNLMIKMLEEGRLTAQKIVEVAEKIADFHAVAETSPEIDKYGTVVAMRFTTDENFEQTEKYVGITLPMEQFSAIKDYTNNFYLTHKDLFDDRIRKHKIKDCHGDLHMEHICLDEPITIFDCIEFNDRFRYIDTACDIAFLAMDLDFHTRFGRSGIDRKELSKVLVDAYVTRSGDGDVYELMTFYKVYRAYVRGKVISFRLNDEHISPEDKDVAADTARKYFELAISYIRADG